MKRAPILIMTIALAASVAWNLRLRSQLEDQQALVANQGEQIQSLTAALQKSKDDLAHQKLQTQEEVRSGLQTLQGLKTRLKAQQDRMEEAHQRLLDAKANNREGEGDDASSLQESLRQEKAYIAELQGNLKRIHQNEAKFGAQTNRVRNQQGPQQTQAMDEINNQIQSQQALIQETLARVTDLKNELPDPDDDTQQQLLIAHKRLKEQRAALAQLRQQKKNLMLQWKAKRVALNEGVPAKLTALKQSETELRQTLQQEQARYQSLQKQVNSYQHDRQSRLNQIKQLEMDYQAQKEKTQELQSALHEQTQKLQLAH